MRERKRHRLTESECIRKRKKSKQRSEKRGKDNSQERFSNRPLLSALNISLFSWLNLYQGIIELWIWVRHLTILILTKKIQPKLYLKRNFAPGRSSRPLKSKDTQR